MDATVRFRDATSDDVGVIVALLQDDVLGAGREAPGDLERYRRAFERIAADDSEHLVVMESDEIGVIGTMQLSVLPGMSRNAATRLQIEGVRVASTARGRGYGELMIAWAIRRGRDLGCDLVQLTSDLRRSEARAFYEGLGFLPSHVGFKLELSGKS